MLRLFQLEITLVTFIQIYAQIGKKLGDECIPGMCSTINSNCKWNGTLFKCVCKEKYLFVNQTHCGLPVSNPNEFKCRECLDRNSLCLDFDNDGMTDECWCPRNGECEKEEPKPSSSKEVMTDVDVEMVVLDATNNRVITDGSTVFLGDQILIDLKTKKRGLEAALSIENCSMSALTNAEDIFVEKIDLIRRGCAVQNDISQVYLNFRSISDAHLESNVFEIFKLRSSALVLLNCWVQVCSSKSSCMQRKCADQSQASPNRQHARIMNEIVSEDDDEIETEYFMFKNTGVRLMVEDPYGIQGHGRSFKGDGLPNIIELEIKSKGFSGLIKSLIISAIAIIFAIIISIISILVYRACVRDNLLNSSTSETPMSICQPSEDCKYDMNARNYEESFFQNPVEPISTQSHNSRW